MNGFAMYVAKLFVDTLNANAADHAVAVGFPKPSAIYTLIMKCIFCKRDSSGSRSVEHIVPESLGNTKLTLPRGTVCDSCNNYFATHVEAPVLASKEFSYLRFHQEIPNKRGRLPSVDAILGGEIVEVHKTGPLQFSFNAKDFEVAKRVSAQGDGQLLVPLSGPAPSSHLTSRWLAKMGLELLALRVSRVEGWNNEFIDHPGLDPVRRFARAPKPGETWAFSRRRLHSENLLEETKLGEQSQLVYECDILATSTAESSEYYFVLSLFGMEYAINLGGDCMDGYLAWLFKNDNASPLHVGKNASTRFRRAVC